MEKTEGCMSLFDVPLHYNFYRASISNGEYNMSQIFDGTIVGTNPEKAVTFVDNHDTELGQALESWILDWFKPLAYFIKKRWFSLCFLWRLLWNSRKKC